ncbi:MAG: hypothetical protein M3Y41_02795, partial [Pseudomonadota bacterium]|nr:hypothetical protein [Pseudomonadota bacterium]
MSDEHDSWFKQAFGVDVSQIADAVTQEASTLAGVVENKVTQVVQDAKDIIEPRLDAVVKGAAGIVKKVAATVS